MSWLGGLKTRALVGGMFRRGLTSQSTGAPRVTNLASAFSQFSEHWCPRVAGSINDMHVKLVKVKGDFIWHHHETEDELFLVTKGTLRMGIRECEDGVCSQRTEVVEAGEFIIIPAMTEHCPSCDEECEIILLEPKGTLNTGTVEDHTLTVKELGSV